MFEEKLKRQAHQRGYKLVPIEEKPAAQGTDLQGSAKEFLERRWPVPRLSLVVVVYYPKIGD